MLALVGFLMVAVIVYCLIQSKTTPVPIFALIPVVAAFAVGLLPGQTMFTPNQVAEFISKGVATTWPVAVLFVFSITFFGVLTDAGMFEPMVNFLVRKAKTNVILVTLATGIISTVAHLDGSLAVTLLITVPAMLPIYKKLNMRPITILIIIGAAMSIMNLLPWGGPVARVAAITKMDINLLWHQLIPLQIAGVVVVLFFSILLGVLEKRRGAGLAAGDSSAIAYAEEPIDEKKKSLMRPKLLWINVIITILTLSLLAFFPKFPPYYCFMAGLAVALLVNYPDPKMQSARIKAHAGDALSMAAILLASGVFLGVLTGTKMIDEMAQAIIYVIPSFIGPYMHLVLGVLSIPIGMILGTDSFFFGLLPIANQVGAQFGIDPINMSKALLIGKNYGVIVTPHAATTFLAIGLAGVELKEHLKVVTLWMWPLGILSLLIAVIMGIVTI